MKEEEKNSLSALHSGAKKRAQALKPANLTIDIVSLFPEYFESPFQVSMLKKAIEKGYIDIRHVDVRSFGKGRHKKVDDRPFGGGPGMVMMAEPITEAVRSVKQSGSRVVYLTPQGKKLTAEKCRELADLKHLILLCGHYEGIDERIIDLEVDEEISIGDYVLTSGAPAAIVLIDAVCRFVPGVVGHPEATSSESFEEGLLDYPQYTAPVEFEGLEVPQVLREGNHKKIAEWRREKQMEKTLQKRPDLLND